MLLEESVKIYLLLFYLQGTVYSRAKNIALYGFNLLTHFTYFAANLR